MKKILITGANRVAGANLAAVLADHFQVTATSPTRTAIGGVKNLTCLLDETLAVQHLVSTVEPDIIVHCGSLAESAWSEPKASASESRIVRNIVSAAQAHYAHVVLVSTDQVYAGPWLFHTETSDCQSTTTTAKLALTCEKLVMDLEDTLILRTHLVGWSPTGDGIVESMIANLERGKDFGFGHFATPIGTSRFASILKTAIEQEVSGIYNVGGAERCSPFGMAAAIAKEFQLPHPVAPVSDVPQETSLRSSLIRERLSVGTPTLRETVEELFEEREERIAVLEGVSKLAAAA